MFLKVTFFNFWAKFGIFCSQLEHTSWLVLTIWLIFIRISLNFLIKVTLLIYVSVQLKSFIFFGSEMLKQKHVWSLGNKSWVLFFLSFITLPLFVLCCFAQVNNSHILVVIHIGMVSQTIKVSINDTPSQVHNSLPQVFLPSTVTLLDFLIYFFLLFRCWRASSPKLQIKGFCWESLTTCVMRILCCVCVAGIAVVYVPLSCFNLEEVPC